MERTSAAPTRPTRRPSIIGWSPPFFADLRAGTHLDAGLGVNLYVPGGPLAGFRLAAEALLPVYQDLDGPQLETDVQLVVGAQYAF